MLPQFLADLSRRKWEWGATDCLMVLADWVVLRRGVDPLKPWRGTYSTHGGARMGLRAAGGMEALLSDAFASGGLERAAEPVAGDVGIVSTPFVVRNGRALWRATGAICVGPDLWALVAERGMIVARPPDIRPLAAWKV